MSRCYAYKIAPIDVGFDHLVSVDDYILYLARYEVNRLLDFISSWDFAKNLAIDAGWEGDIREGPFVFFFVFVFFDLLLSIYHFILSVSTLFKKKITKG